MIRIEPNSLPFQSHSYHSSWSIPHVSCFSHYEITTFHIEVPRPCSHLVHFLSHQGQPHLWHPKCPVFSGANILNDLFNTITGPGPPVSTLSSPRVWSVLVHRLGLLLTTMRHFRPHLPHVLKHLSDFFWTQSSQRDHQK